MTLNIGVEDIHIKNIIDVLIEFITLIELKELLIYYKWIGNIEAGKNINWFIKRSKVKLHKGQL